MSKFIEVHDTIINIADIRKVEFLGDDIHLGLFPRDEDGEILSDYIIFNFAKIHTFDGSVILLSIDLYPPEDDSDEKIDIWFDLNRSYISMTMTQLDDILKPIKLTEKEYE